MDGEDEFFDEIWNKLSKAEQDERIARYNKAIDIEQIKFVEKYFDSNPETRDVIEAQSEYNQLTDAIQ